MHVQRFEVLDSIVNVLPWPHVLWRNGLKIGINLPKNHASPMANLAQWSDGGKMSKSFCWLNTIVAIRTEAEETVGVACAEIFLNSPNLSDIHF